MYFISTGTLLFGLVYVIFTLLSKQFAGLAVESSMHGISKEIASTLYVDDQGAFQLDDSEINLKWGFDALYSNLAFRLVDVKQQKAVFYSVPYGTKGFLFNDIDVDIPLAHSYIDKKSTRLYRMTMQFGDGTYYFDVARSDLLAELADEAIEPAIADVTNASIFVSFILFLILTFIAIRLIIKPAEALTRQINSIEPEDLKQRLDIAQVPLELQPIALAMNDALERVEQGFAEQKRFIADAAHELRTPLTIFLNRLELKIPHSEAKNELINDARFISRIVEQLLDLSRAQNLHGREVAKLNLTEIVKNVCTHLAPMAVDKGHDLELITNEGCDTIEIDEGELTVVIKNLLENAIKHTPANGEIKVTVSAKQLAIADSGKGIDEEDYLQVFDRFWRKNQSDRSGSGLGMAITKALLDHYDATIKISRDEHLGGAKFTVDFK